MRNGKIERQFHPPSDKRSFNIVGLLKIYAKQKDLAKGSKLHAYIRKHKFLENDSHIASGLINMYARCGALAKVQEVLNRLPVQDVVVWTTLIASYVQQGQAEEALKCFDTMQHEGHSPDAVTFTCALKACGSIKAADKGKWIHERIENLGMLEKDIMLGNAVVGMYSRCGELVRAQQVLLQLPLRNVVTWTALIAGYANHGQEEEALKCLDKMIWEGHSPNAVTFISALQACGRIGAIAKGEQIHDKILSLGMLEKNVALGTSLVNMYARCGVLPKAHQVFVGLPVWNVATWNALIAGYAQQGQGEEALICFDGMLQEGSSSLDAITFTCALKGCGSVRAVAKGERIHVMIMHLGLLKNDIMLGNALLDMYARCGAFAKAQQVFEGLPVRNVVTWNVLIAGYTQQGHGEEALKCYDRMQRDGHSPDVVTFTCALKACGTVRAAIKGKKIHETIANLGILEKDIAIGNALVDMYARCGELVKAEQVLKELPVRNVVTWNTLIGGYVQQGQGEEALECFYTMECQGHDPNVVTFVHVLRACGNIGAVTKGEKIHNKIVSLRMLEKSIVLGSALVDMYAKCGVIVRAQQVLEALPVRDVVMWTALIAGYVQQEQGKEALECFDSMQWDGHSPDVVTFTCAVKACGIIGSVTKGVQIHERVVKLGMMEKDIMLRSALVDMYAKCAAFSKAAEVLKEFPVQDVVIWNALIGGHAQHGQSTEALNCFETMQSKGVEPNSTTLICVLNACSHSGLLDKAEMCFLRMSTAYGITPEVEHYCCMIDLFGRAGHFGKVFTIVEKMPCAEHLPVWLALLSACRKWQDVKFGRFAFERALHSHNRDVAPYVCMANIYTAVDMQEYAVEIEVMIMANKAGIHLGDGSWEMKFERETNI